MKDIKLIGKCLNCGGVSHNTYVGWECVNCFCPDVSETEVVDDLEIVEVKVVECNTLWGASLL